MKRSKTQAVYRFLPEMWISEKDDSERAVSAKIKNWNYINMSDIYEDFIEGETIFYKGIMPSEKVSDLPVDCNTLAGSVNL